MSALPASQTGFHHALACELAELRRGCHTSQGTLAGELGVDQASVSRVESGQRRLTVAEAFAWFEALGIPPSETARRLQRLWEMYG